MIAADLAQPDDFDAWRDQARRLVEQAVPPDQIAWSDGNGPADLFAVAPPLRQPSSPRSVRASRPFVDLARSAILHTDPARLGLLYRVLWRMQDNPRLLDDAADRDVALLERLAKQVRRDIHKMRAFVRFRSIQDDDGELYVAWFEPDHRIERANADFFINRFASQRWSILTPRLSLHWDGATLLEGPPARREDAPREDATEELWLGYYSSIFNPARLKVGMMVKEMPRRYWKNLPEARRIPDLIAGAREREIAMIATGSSLFETTAVPESLSAVAQGMAQCTKCPIGCNGTRAVMGEGPADADVMIVGEQPGDTEERDGRPFVGPAGQLLDQALDAAGIDRARTYVTNAVKHFKFVPRGKRRLHQTPTAGEIDICRWWLDAERALIKPKVILALGASGARGLLGRTPSIGRERGQAIAQSAGASVWLTAHPSYLLRLDGTARAREHDRFAQDLAGLAQVLRHG